MTERVAEKMKKSMDRKLVSRIPGMAGRISPSYQNKSQKLKNQNRRSPSLPDITRGRVVNSTEKRSSQPNQPINDQQVRDSTQYTDNDTVNE